MYVQAIPIYPGTIRTTRRGTILLDLMRIMRGCVFQMIIATSPKSTLKAIKCTGTLVLLCIAVERVKRQAQVALTASAIPCPRGLNVCPKSASGATAAPTKPCYPWLGSAVPYALLARESAFPDLQPLVLLATLHPHRRLSRHLATRTTTWRITSAKPVRLGPPAPAGRQPRAQ